MKSAPVRQAVAVLSVFLILVSLPLPLLAQEQRADITVYQIAASNGEPGIDPQIQSLVKEFEGTFRYSTYKLVSKTPMQMKVGENDKIVLAGNREMHLQMLGYDGNRIKLNVKVIEKQNMKRNEVLNTEFRLTEGGTILIGGYDYRDGRLIVAISAK